MDGAKLQDPWEGVSPEDAQGLLRELFLEVSASSPLRVGKPEIIGRRVDSDDILIALDSPENSFAVVHLTWSGKHEVGGFPGIAFYGSLKEALEFVD